MRQCLTIMGIVCLGLLSCENGCNKSEPPAVGVHFISPKEGDVVQNPIKIVMGLKGMKLRPAGEDVTDKTSGHHHILIDNVQGYISQGTVVPADDYHLHYGKAQTEATIKLLPGKHRISLQLADGAHLSYGKDLSDSIDIMVD